jgi:hypothetical protein
MVGLFGTTELDCHPWSLGAGAIASTVFIFGIYFGHLDSCGDCGGINAGILGILIQAAVIALFEGIRRTWLPEHWHSPATSGALIFPNRPQWDIPKRARFGENPLTPTLVWKMMKGTDEPFANRWYCTLLFVTISMVTPFVAPGLPVDVADLGDVVTNGLPWWVIKMFSLAVLPTVILLIAMVRMPNRYSLSEWRRDDSKLDLISSTQETAVDPDVIEMTPEELCHRTSYDSRNELVYRRRMQILQKLGISPAEIEFAINATMHPSSGSVRGLGEEQPLAVPDRVKVPTVVSFDV